MDRFELFGKMIDAFFEGSRIFSKYDKIPRKYGTGIELYMSEMHTLDLINKNEGTTVTNLANRTKKTKSAITQITNKLQKKGLINKLRNDDNYKEVNLSLTELGRQTCAFHKSSDEKKFRKAVRYVKDYSNDDLQKCYEIFTIITRSLNKDELGGT
jgi:DNA-binding MarR family transcriptional regulator